MSLALFGFVQNSWAKDDPSYTPEEAAKHIGETATVTGKIEDFHQASGGSIFLNMGGRHPKETFTIFIPAGEAAAFKDAKDYEGKTVAVTGKIKDHEGKPEMIVKNASDIVVKEEGSSAAAPSSSPAASASASPAASP